MDVFRAATDWTVRAGEGQGRECMARMNGRPEDMEIMLAIGGLTYLKPFDLSPGLCSTLGLRTTSSTIRFSLKHSSSACLPWIEGQSLSQDLLAPSCLQ